MASPDKWIVVYYRDTDEAKDSGLTEEMVLASGMVDPAPARLFLKNCPTPVRGALRGTVVAVRDYPPLSFPTSTKRWKLMHKSQKKGEVDMSGIFEVGDKHDKDLYRLFCLIDSQAPSHGLKAPALVLLSGTVKPVNTVVPQSIYKEVRRQADRYFSMSPRPVMLE